MRKKDLLAWLDEHQIRNDWEILKRFGNGFEWCITYYKNPPGRLGYGGFNKTVIWNCDRRQKTFTGKKNASLPEALAWAKSIWADMEWVPSPFSRNSFITKQTMERIIDDMESHSERPSIN